MKSDKKGPIVYRGSAEAPPPLLLGEHLRLQSSLYVGIFLILFSIWLIVLLIYALFFSEGLRLTGVYNLIIIFPFIFLSFGVYLLRGWYCLSQAPHGRGPCGKAYFDIRSTSEEISRRIEKRDKMMLFLFFIVVVIYGISDDEIPSVEYFIFLVLLLLSTGIIFGFAFVPHRHILTDEGVACGPTIWPERALGFYPWSAFTGFQSRPRFDLILLRGPWSPAHFHRWIRVPEKLLPLVEAFLAQHLPKLP